MDSKQKLLLETNKCSLASALDYDNISDLLRTAKVIDETIIADIEVKARSKYSRNLLLIAALKEAQSSDPFSKFITILKVSKSLEALRLISPDSLQQVRSGIKMFDQHRRIFSQTPYKYPLGLQSKSSGDDESIGEQRAYSRSSPSSQHQQEVRRDSNDSTHSSNVDQDAAGVCWHPPEATAADQAHCCLPTKVATPSTSQSSIMSETVSIEPSTIVQCIAELHDMKTTMKVQTATTTHMNFDENYKMVSRPRGPCLIINNIDFDSDIFPRRKGSDEDAKAFDVIFQQLGFVVVLRRNQTASQLKSICKEIASQCKKEHDALFVILLSHGSESGVYGVDGIEVDLNDIVSYFDNKNCKAMIGKPKVFVIQACRGRLVDYGETDNEEVVHTQSQQEWSQVSAWTSPNSQIPFNRRSEFTKGQRGNLYPVRSDMLLVFSCLAGYVSVRNELVGSWLGAALSYCLLKHAHEKDLSRILNMVSADIKDRISHEGYTQCIEVTHLGWSKNLYFNPGYYGF